ncbi:MAG: hypothetical protein JNL57_06950 [Bacteroidetes bacterium]|nr:hypothetical protein [Bacteroidota bacterium]
MNPEIGTTITNQESGFDQIIDQVVAYVKGEELEISSGVAPRHKQEIWEQLFKGNLLPMLKLQQNQNNEVLGAQLAIGFLRRLVLEYKTTPQKLALSQKNNKVYVWAEIQDDDEASMDAILAATIDTNFEHRDSGLTLSPMIVEQREMIPVPPHYKLLTNYA